MLSESDIKEKVNATEYWYFRFNEHFFDDIKIAQMETLPGGFEMLVILLKLYCLSVKEECSGCQMPMGSRIMRRLQN